MRRTTSAPGLGQGEGGAMAWIWAMAGAAAKPPKNVHFAAEEIQRGPVTALKSCRDFP